VTDARVGAIINPMSGQYLLDLLLLAPNPQIRTAVAGSPQADEHPLAHLAEEADESALAIDSDDASREQ